MKRRFLLATAACAATAAISASALASAEPRVVAEGNGLRAWVKDATGWRPIDINSITMEATYVTIDDEPVRISHRIFDIDGNTYEQFIIGDIVIGADGVVAS